MGSVTAVGEPRPGSIGRSSPWVLSEFRWAAGALASFLAGGVAQLAGAPAALYWALYLVCYVVGGWEPAWAGLQMLRARTLDVDLLMVVAAVGAAAIGQVVDGALLIVIFATSGALEAFATRRTADAVRGLTDLAPEQAVLLANGVEREVAAADLTAGDDVLVRPGERIPVDGVVVAGSSEVDQASITGEPLPVDKAAGDQVFAGTRNGSGVLTIAAMRPARDSVVNRIAVMVEEASATKAHTQLFIDKVEQRYSVGVVLATLAIFVIPLLAGAGLQDCLLRAMTFMIVASPCAVVLATMPPLLSAIANASRHGVLVKSAVVMERLGTATVLALDKTGTLTNGTPAVVAVHPLPGSSHGAGDLLALAAAAEAASEHPIGQAIVAAARERGIDLLPAESFRAEVGRGVTATVAGRTVAVGSPASARTSGVPAVTAMVDGEQAYGHTAVVVSLDGRPAGVVALADRIRPEAASCVAAMKTWSKREPVLLTGDNARSARALGDATGLDDVRAGLLPEDKVAAVRELQRAGQRVLLVGDGINDAPALAAADIGVAMGGIGSDLAMSTADVVIVRDDLGALTAVTALSRRACRLIVQNLVIASVVIATLITWDLVGHLPLPLGVAGHEGSTILVALNGLRMLRRSEWKPST